MAIDMLAPPSAAAWRQTMFSGSGSPAAGVAADFQAAIDKILPAATTATTTASPAPSNSNVLSSNTLEYWFMGHVQYSSEPSPAPEPPLFASIDASGNGLISREEFVATFGTNNDVAANQLFRVLDRNGDLSIDGTELAPAPGQASAAPQPSAVPTSVNPSIGAPAWDDNVIFGLLPGMNPAGIPGSASQPLFARLDGNQDGVLSPAEFAAAYSGPSNPSALFPSIDGNGNGSLDWTELARIQAGGTASSAPSSNATGGFNAATWMFGAIASSSTVTNPDGSTTTTLNYANSSVVTIKTAAGTPASAADAEGGLSTVDEFFAALIQHQAWITGGAVEPAPSSETIPPVDGEGAPPSDDGTATAPTTTDPDTTATDTTAAAEAGEGAPPSDDVTAAAPSATDPDATPTDTTASAEAGDGSDGSSSATDVVAGGADPSSGSGTAESTAASAPDSSSTGSAVADLATTTVENEDGSTTTTVNYQDGSVITFTLPANASTQAAMASTEFLMKLKADLLDALAADESTA